MQELFASIPFGSRLQHFVPSTHVVAIVAPLAAVYALFSAWLAGRLKVKRGMRTPYTRKIFHFLVFTMAGAVQLQWRTPGVVVFGAVVSLVVFYAVWRGSGHPFYEALARPTDAPHRTLFIVIPWITTALGGFISNLLFPGFASVGYFVCGWGDAVGEPVGSRFGKHKYRVPSLSGVPAMRSLEGSAAVLVCGSAAAMVSLLMDGFALQPALTVGAVCGLCGALVEAISNHGLDNLTTQIAGSAVAYFFLG
jgi:phytol kinase